MMRKVVKNRALFRWLTFLPATMLLILVAFWTLYPYQVSSVAVPIEILNKNKEIAIGENIQMLIRVDKPNNIKPEGTTYITCDDGNLVTLLSLVNNLPVGEYTVINDKYILPPKVLPGSRCRFNFRNAYRVNPMRTITKEWYSEQFLVVKEV